MPGDYSTRFGSRLCPASSEADTTTARFFLCAGCRAQVFVCRHCDRGQIYCAGACAQDARQQAQRMAGQRYQESYPGRLNHAARTRRYRARQKIVTHQGSPPRPQDDGVGLDAVPFAGTATASKPAAVRDVVMRFQGSSSGFCRCHWCGERCSPLLRNDFLRRRQRGSSHDRKRRKHYDYPN
jgi:hypothetical protein